MPLIDMFGQSVTLDDETALAAWNQTMLGVLAHSASTPCALANVRDVAPDFALGHAMRGLCCMILGRGELLDIAGHDLANARLSLGKDRASARERLYVDALAAWTAGRPSEAAALMDRVLAQWPHDALALKIGHSIRFMMGDPKGMLGSVASVLDHYEDDHPARGYVLGCHAFALEETGDMAGAEAAGRQALEIAPDDAWGLHAVDHVYDMTARARDGVAWLTANRSSWDGANNFRFHLWWHLALHHLELGDIEQVLDLYDSEVRREHTDDFRDVANGASLLARLEIEGVDVGHRWDELADIAERREDDSALVFAGLHYLIALVGAGRQKAAAAHVRRLSRDATRGQSEMDGVARAAGVPAAEAIAAFWTGRPDDALDAMLVARPNLLAVGGSHAQRDIFDRIAIEAAMRAGRFDTASTLIDDRARHRGAMDRFAEVRRALIASGQGVSEPAGALAQHA